MYYSEESRRTTKNPHTIALFFVVSPDSEILHFAKRC
jgi:hypothetical protein